ncbi:hypothetical protein TNIN_377661 [Trichonephila inaurata madagascariensis]|uniref:Uncharacterized protein n=1 Tax=Trichonephila inaurata madagascariensis TaxID=2747483 RepID=A0A8X6YBX4_9ARAC|nr:hypothetical protein TNIN_377661 [Trichonephila inaurata madagascariensis]
MGTFYCRCDVFDQPESILPPVTQLVLSQSKLDGRFQLHQQFWNGLAKISSPNCTLIYVTNTSLRKLETFLCEYFFIQVLSPMKIGPQHATLLSYNHSALSPFLKLHYVCE